MSGTRGRRLAIDLVRFAPSLVVPGLMGLAAVPLLVGQLGLADYGKWALIWTAAQTVSVVGTHWLESTIIRFTRETGAPANLAGLAGVAVVASSVIGAAVVAVLVPGAGPFDIAAGALLTAAVGWYLVAIAGLMAGRRFGRYSLLSALRSVGSWLAAVVAAAVTHDVWASVLSAAVVFALVSLAAGSAPLRRPRLLDREGLVQVRTFGVPSSFLAAASLVVSVADRFILARYWPLEIVGTYAAVYGIIDLTMRLIPTAIGSVARPTVFRLWDATGSSEAAVLVARLTVFTAVICAAVACALAGLGSLILDSLGGSWGAARPAFVAILAGATLQAVATIANIAYGAENRQWTATANMVLAAVANVVLNLVLVPAGGMMAAALATVVAYALLLLLTLGRVQPEVRQALAAPELRPALAVTVIVPFLVLYGIGAGAPAAIAAPVALAASLLVAGMVMISPQSRRIARTLTDPITEAETW